MADKKIFGVMKNGETDYLYTLKNSKGMTVEIHTFGAGLRKIVVPDRNGKFDDVLLGYDNPDSYNGCNDYSGLVVGPVTNRIHGSFIIDGKTYTPSANLDNGNTLHSNGDFSFSIWNVEKASDNSITLSYETPDGKEGFPGNRKATVTYTVTENNELSIEYYAVSDKKTYFNLTNHAYFNLNGSGSGDVLTHEIKINADKYIPTDEVSIPYGRKDSVDGTPFDLREFHAVGEGINDVSNEQIKWGRGYDHSICINNYTGELNECVVVKSPESGRKMTCSTTLPGVQFYTGNYLEGLEGKYGKKNEFRYGLCLETQYHPDAIHCPAFEQCVFDKDEAYTSKTVFAFGVE